MKVNVTLAFKGNCEEALNFYSKVFNKEIAVLSKFKDMPNVDSSVKESDLEKVIHSVLEINEHVAIMANDDIMNHSTSGTSAGISLNFDNTENLEEAENIYNMLTENGNVIMPFEKTFWGAYYGAIVDQFGVWWQINYQIENL
ncbi:MAG: VOC family protein [Bacilli bacterium]